MTDDSDTRPDSDNDSGSGSGSGSSSGTGATPSLADMTAFARRHGLGHLHPEHIARLRELAAPVAGFGRMVRRPPNKEDAPAPEFRVREP